MNPTWYLHLLIEIRQRKNEYHSWLQSEDFPLTKCHILEHFLSTIKMLKNDTLIEDGYPSSSIEFTEEGHVIYETCSERILEYDFTTQCLVCDFGKQGSVIFADFIDSCLREARVHFGNWPHSSIYHTYFHLENEILNAPPDKDEYFGLDVNILHIICLYYPELSSLVNDVLSRRKKTCGSE